MDEMLIYFFLAGIVTFIASRLFIRKSEKSTKRLSHNQMLRILERHGYTNLEGVCFGTSLTLARYYAHDEINQVFDYLSQFRKKQHLILDTDEGEAEIPNRVWAIANEVVTSQDPQDHIEIYGKMVWQPDIDAILKRHDRARNRAALLYKRTIGFSGLEKSRDFFSKLEKLLDTPRLSLLLSDLDHTVWLTFSKGFWHLLDTNTMFKQTRKQPYLMFDKFQLTDYLKKNMAQGFGRRMVYNFDLIGPNNLDISRHVNWLNHYNSDTLEMEYISTGHKVSLLWFSASWGDVFSVKKALARGLSPFKHFHTSDYAPIVGAIQLNRVETLKAMLSTPSNTLVRQRRTDAQTLLHIAAIYGAADCLDYLLAMNRIPIDAQDIDGRTALMIACMCEIKNQNTMMVRLLIEHGAGLDIRSNKKLRAVDYARKNKDPSVLEYFNFFTRKKDPFSTNNRLEYLEPRFAQ